MIILETKSQTFQYLSDESFLILNTSYVLRNSDNAGFICSRAPRLAA